MATTSPHIHFNGNAEEAFEFYRSVLGGQFIRVMRLKICLLNWGNATSIQQCRIGTGGQNSVGAYNSSIQGMFK
jgi:predicted 3-demethylubiquinone-9 3-methyltransferase (glyoxalase superfamily)